MTPTSVPRHRHAVRGFTLVEVLVALLVLAIGLAALIQTGTSLTRNTLHIQERLLGHWVGQNLLAAYEAGLHGSEMGTREGRTQQAGREWNYRVHIAWMQPESLLELPPILRIDIEVWPDTPGIFGLRSRVTGYRLP